MTRDERIAHYETQLKKPEWWSQHLDWPTHRRYYATRLAQIHQPLTLPRKEHHDER